MTRPTPSRFMDTNILVRYYTGEPPDQAQRARSLLKAVERGDEKVVTSVMVLFETVFTLQRTYRVPKHSIREFVAEVFSLPALLLPGKRLCLEALDLYAEQPNLSYADAYNVLFMRGRRVTEAYTWDRDFDGVDGITRVEPA